MTEPSAPQMTDDLAEHGRFVRNLAWRLLHDEDAAEEVVQETMLAAVKAKPSRDRSLRPWLATVARNVIRRRFRGRSRRRKREEAASKPEAVPATVDMLARAEMLRTVVDAVLSLDEPNRTTVLLRYYEDLPPREIAARLGVGVETVRGRLKRAAKQLRSRLDRVHPGGRASWVPVLAGLCGMDTSAAVLGGSAGTTAGTSASASATAPSAAAGGFKGLAAAFAVGAIAAGAVSWWIVEPMAPSDLGSATDLSIAKRKDIAASHPGTAPEEEATRLRGASAAVDRLAAARTRNAELKAVLEKLRERVKALEPRPTDPHAFRFALPDAVPVFDQADWGKLAGHMLGLSKVLRDIRVEVVTVHEPSAKSLSATLQHNQPLSAFAIAIAPEMEEANPNVAYSHPAVIANLIRAALVLGEMPLTHVQEVAIHTLGTAWEAESARAVAALPAEAPALARVVAEVDAKLRFLRAVKDTLTDRQREYLFHPESEDRLQLDILSPGVVYSALRAPADADDRSGLEEVLLSTLFSLAGRDDIDLAPFASVARRWIDEIPDVLTPRLPWNEDVAFESIESAQAKARAQVRAIERILGMGRLDDETAEALRRVENLLRPRIRCVVPDGPDAWPSEEAPDGQD